MLKSFVAEDHKTREVALSAIRQQSLLAQPHTATWRDA